MSIHKTNVSSTHMRGYTGNENGFVNVSFKNCTKKYVQSSSVQGHLTGSAADVGVFAVRRVLRDPTAVQAVLVSPVRSLTETSDKIP